MVGLAQRIDISENVLCEYLDGDAVLLDLTGETYFTLKGTSARMWELLTNLKDNDAVIEQLLIEFDVERSIVEQDLAELIADGAKAGILHVSDS